MSRSHLTRQHAPLLAQMRWFIRLRWIAALVVIAGSFADAQWMNIYPYPWRGVAVGATILAYNALLWWLLHRVQRAHRRREPLLLLAWAQLLFDLTCLTLLTVWTEGLGSPLRGFFVLHMVFASLLLPRTMAYATAAIAPLMLTSALSFSGQWPASGQELLALIGWSIMLFMTVYVAGRIVRHLRQQRSRLIRQNRKIQRITRQLRRHQQAMVQQEKMVALGQMAAGIAHEVANPLASIDGLLQLMQRQPDRQRPQAIDTLREQVKRIHQTLQQMKTFAHPGDMRRETVELNNVVERAVEMIRLDPRASRVPIQLALALDVGAITLTPQALHQIIVNLLINALDALDQVEHPRVMIRTSRRDSTCLIEISDNGTGIRPEHMPRLFEPFFTTKPVGRGTGLGLSLSYRLTENMGGTIHVHSEWGRGTTFTIRLPAEAPPSREREDKPVGVVAPEKSED